MRRIVAEFLARRICADTVMVEITPVVADGLIVVHGFWLHLFRRLVERFSVAQCVESYPRECVENASVTRYRGELVNGHSRLVRIELGIVPWHGRL